MRVTKLSVVELLLLVGASLVGGAVASESQTNSPTLQLATLREPMVGRDPILRAYVTSGNKRFTFVVPGGFRLDSSKPGELLMTSSDFACAITLRVANLVTPAKAVTADAFRGLVTARYAETQITDEFSMTAADGTGPAYDLQGKTPEGLSRHARVGFVPAGGQLLEFSLVANPDKFSTFLGDLQSIILTFRVSDADGKPDIAVLSDRI